MELISIDRPLGFLLALTAIGAGVGALCGVLVGATTPYYQIVFELESSSVNPVSLGFGLGLTQGAGAGFGGALLLIAVRLFNKAWREEQPVPAVPVQPATSITTQRLRKWNIILTVILSLTVITAVYLSLFTFFKQLQTDMRHSVYAVADNEGHLHVQSYSQSPILVTGLICGYDHALLETPILVTHKGYLEIPTEELEWMNSGGEPQDPPAAWDQVQLVYEDVEVSRQR